MKINERNLNLFATNGPFDKEGYLNKRGELNKAFQKRYFVLKGNLLFYFEKKGDKEPLGLIILEGCTIELAEEFGGDLYCFQIVFCGNRSYILAASSQEEMESWMKLLTCAGYTYKNLIISDLQCRLEEIKNSQNRNANNLIGGCSGNNLTPKSPLKRQNPFNRPAPPAPPLPGANSSLQHQQQQQQWNQPHQPTALLNYNQRIEEKNPDLPTKSGGMTSTQKWHHHNDSSTFYQQLHNTPSSTSTSFYCNGGEWDRADAATTNILTTATAPYDPQLFSRAHEQYREIVMKDILSYNAKRKLKDQPLIVL